MNMKEKRTVLEELIANLSQLSDMLNLEPRPEQRYAHHVEPYLQEAKRLADEGFSFEELKEFSFALDSLFNRSFLDYVPGGSLIVVPGTEEYPAVLSKVSTLALELRVLGSY